MSDSLTLYEGIDLVLNATAQIDQTQNYWLSATFAVVLTAFVARNHLNLLVTSVISLLYILGTLLFFTRTAALAELLQVTVENSPEAIQAFRPTTSLDHRPLLLISRLGSYFLGFLGAQLYLWISYWRKIRDL